MNYKTTGQLMCEYTVDELKTLIHSILNHDNLNRVSKIKLVSKLLTALRETSAEPVQRGGTNMNWEEILAAKEIKARVRKIVEIVRCQVKTLLV